MRYTPAALALSLAAALTASAGFSNPRQALNPRAVALVEEGQAKIAGGDVNGGIDNFESALTVAPADVRILLHLAEATRLQGMQGKALRYYREALEAEPQNVRAISGEGAALVEKGAIEKARRNLARLEGLCGRDCDATRELAAVIARGPAPRMVSADAVTPDPVVTQN